MKVKVLLHSIGACTLHLLYTAFLISSARCWALICSRAVTMVSQEGTASSSLWCFSQASHTSTRQSKSLLQWLPKPSTSSSGSFRALPRDLQRSHCLRRKPTSLSRSTVCSFTRLCDGHATHYSKALPLQVTHNLEVLESNHPPTPAPPPTPPTCSQ